MRKLFGKVGNWFGNYLFFSKATLCIRGLVLGHSLAYYAVFSILIVYLTEQIWATPNFEIAAAIINVLQGITNIMVIALAYISYTCLGPFKVIVYTTALYILYVSSFFCSKLIRKNWKHATLVRIGCGLVCSVLCCAVAWQVELRRSHKIKTEVKDNNSIISMSVLWLIPQFSLLGVMRGIAVEGLVEFFADRVVEEDGKLMAMYYGCHASDFVFGIAALLTAVSILVLRHTWLDENAYRYRLDKYYRGLTFLGFANLCYYLLVASYLYKKDKHSLSSAADKNEERPTEIPDGEAGERR
ncbi:hypothetical protein M0R45_009401 [Rubus argutus]|uniref:Uncharacterized protein n=1 Tax=Rubus argutus TaxID=59490 RepID=A0AAW1Y416_RUBAR